MPLYDYQCLNCNHEFEAIRRIDERHDTDCERCGKGAKLCYRGRAPGVAIFRAGTYQVQPYKPKHYETAQQLREDCDRFGKVSPYLEDSGFRTSPGPDYTPSKDPLLRRDGRTVAPD